MDKLSRLTPSKPIAYSGLMRGRDGDGAHDLSDVLLTLGRACVTTSKPATAFRHGGESRVWEAGLVGCPQMGMCLQTVLSVGDTCIATPADC